LGGKVENNKLHFDFELGPQELEELLACFQSLSARGDEHVAVMAEFFEVVDELSEFCAPGEDAELAVLLVTAIEHVWRGFERIVEYLVLVDHAG